MNPDKLKKIKLMKILICVVSILISLLGAYKIYKNANEYGELVKKKEKLEGQLTVERANYDEYKKTAQENAYEEAKNGDNTEAKEIAIHNESYLIMSTVSNAFFKEFFTWNDSESYIQRSDNVSSVATEEIRKNKSIFDDGTDSLGGNYVDNTGIKSEFISSKVYPEDNENSIVQVTYKSWFNDDKNISNDSTSYYYVTFNRDNQMITKLKRLFTPED